MTHIAAGLTVDLACPCGAGDFETVHLYATPPPGETAFPGVGPGDYWRQLRRCRTCGHFISVSRLPRDGFYGGRYVDSTYGDAMHRAYERIMALDPACSDNAGRVRRILAFAGDRGFRGGRTLLDVGSGLGVFCRAMKQAGWSCTALDPDPRACRHAEEVVGVEAVCADFRAHEAPGRFDAVTFNKVLEHVEDPVSMLSRAAEFLRPHGFVYVELPDGEAALADGPHREEFYIEHWHAFSMASAVLLACRGGLVPVACERLREPSGKYTLRAFLEPAGAGSRGGSP